MVVHSDTVVHSAAFAGHVRLADFDLCKHTLKENGELGTRFAVVYMPAA